MDYKYKSVDIWNGDWSKDNRKKYEYGYWYRDEPDSYYISSNYRLYRNFKCWC